VRISAETST